MKLRLVIAALLAGLVVGGVLVAAIAFSSDQPARIAEAVATCEEASGGTLPGVEQDEASVTLRVPVPTAGAPGSDADVYAAALCVLAELDMPAALASRMETTSQLDGQQTADHDGLAYSWTMTDGGIVVTVVEED